MKNELYHFGIKGMKWGVRRYQNPDGSLTPAGRKRYAEELSNEKSDSTSIGKGKRQVDKQLARKISTLSEFQGSGEIEALAFQAISVASLVGISAVASHVRRKKASKEALKDAMRELDDLYNNREFNSLQDVPRLSKKMSAKDSVKHVNPDFPDTGSTMNCTFCTTAMAMREKGYDVVANKTPSPWPSKELFDKTFNSPTIKMNKKQTAKQMTDSLASYGDGAYGNLGVRFKSGGGHSVFWKNVNGKTHIYDGQSGEEYDVSTPESSSFLNKIQLDNVMVNRLDNCQPTDYALALLKKRR